MLDPLAEPLGTFLWSLDEETYTFAVGTQRDPADANDLAQASSDGSIGLDFGDPLFDSSRLEDSPIIHTEIDSSFSTPPSIETSSADSSGVDPALLPPLERPELFFSEASVLEFPELDSNAIEPPVVASTALSIGPDPDLVTGLPPAPLPPVPLSIGENDVYVAPPETPPSDFPSSIGDDLDLPMPSPSDPSLNSLGIDLDWL